MLWRIALRCLFRRQQPPSRPNLRHLQDGPVDVPQAKTMVAADARRSVVMEGAGSRLRLRQINVASEKIVSLLFHRIVESQRKRDGCRLRTRNNFLYTGSKDVIPRNWYSIVLLLPGACDAEFSYVALPEAIPALLATVVRQL